MTTREETFATIEQQLKENPVLIYMKGSPDMPQCGFSANACQALSACGAKFGYVDILQQPDIRRYLPEHANWPTFPQLYIKGQLVGGCDIILQLYEQGELKNLLSEVTEV